MVAIFSIIARLGTVHGWEPQSSSSLVHEARPVVIITNVVLVVVVVIPLDAAVFDEHGPGVRRRLSSLPRRLVITLHPASVEAP